MFSHCGFDLHFPIPSVVNYLLICLLAICISSLEECLFKCIDQLCIELFVFLLNYVSSLYILIIIPYQIYNVQYFLSFCELSFYFLSNVFETSCYRFLF